MKLAAAMVQNGSAQISGKLNQGRAPSPFELNVKWVVANEVFNPNERNFSSGGHVAPGMYKVCLVRDPHVHDPHGPNPPEVGPEVWTAFSDLLSCEHFVQSQLKDYDPDGWQPSTGIIIDLYVRTDEFNRNHPPNERFRDGRYYKE